MSRMWLIGLGLCLFSASVMADVRMGALFSDGMVIQRDTLAPVWGWADSGEKIQISASWGAKAKTVAKADGTWRVNLKTPQAGGPHKIRVAGKNTVTIDDVLSGEVWLCAGQSNMDFPLLSFSSDAKEPEYQSVSDYIRKEMETARDPSFRQITVPKTTSPHEKKDTFTGSWISAVPGSTRKFTGTGYFFGRELRSELDVPVGLVKCAWGGTRIQPWISEEAYLSNPEMADYYRHEMAELEKRSKDWNPQENEKNHQAAVAKWNGSGKKGRRPRMKKKPEEALQLPTTLYNGMLAPVVSYAIKGAIWYQGESNADYMQEEYEDYFTTLIRSWRKEWDQGDFPFYFAQLASFREANPDPLEEESWADIRDQQRRTLKLPNTGMAVLSDIGEAKDIHPRNKVDAGKRLALWALAKDYGVDIPACSGPLYKSHTISGNKVRITFSHAGTGLMVGNKHLLDAVVEVDEPLKRFQVCGKGRDWKWANVRMVSRDSVEVWHSDIAKPTVVRYAWSRNPEGANLYNKEGLPASIFTTEKDSLDKN